MAPKWTDELNLKFVELYKVQSCLWDQLDDSYKNKNTSETALSAIVENMNIQGFGVAEIKAKIKAFRGTFNIEFSKQQKSAKSGCGSANVYMPTLKWFNSTKEVMAKGTLTWKTICTLIVSLNKLPLDKKCQTACGDSGCRCLPTDGDLHAVNHLVLSSKDNDLSCLCGDFQQEWLPVGIRSWSPTSIIYSVAHSVWNKGFHYQAEFTFHSDISCGHQILNQHSGHITSMKLEESAQLNYYYYQSCTWVLDSNVLRQLTVDVESYQNRPCTSWNITLHEYVKRNPDKTGKLLYTFCPRSRNMSYALPWEQNIIVIRLNAMTRILPTFSFKWKSQITRSNTRVSGVVPAQSSRSSVISLAEILIIVTFILYL